MFRLLYNNLIVLGLKYLWTIQFSFIKILKIPSIYWKDFYKQQYNLTPCPLSIFASYSRAYLFVLILSKIFLVGWPRDFAIVKTGVIHLAQTSGGIQLFYGFCKKAIHNILWPWKKLKKYKHNRNCDAEKLELIG